MDKKKIADIPADLDWVQLRKDMDASVASNNLSANEEPLWDRFKRKMTQNPLVPIGMVATVCALGYGLLSFKRGDKVMSQKMMRTRVAAQGFTIFVAVGGLMLSQRDAITEESKEKEGEPKAVA